MYQYNRKATNSLYTNRLKQFMNEYYFDTYDEAYTQICYDVMNYVVDFDTIHFVKVFYIQVNTIYVKVAMDNNNKFYFEFSKLDPITVFTMEQSLEFIDSGGELIPQPNVLNATMWWLSIPIDSMSDKKKTFPSHQELEYAIVTCYPTIIKLLNS